MTNIRFIASSSASSLHAARGVLNGGAVVGDNAISALQPAAESLRRAVYAASLNEDDFFRHAIPLAGGTENDRSLAEVLLRKLGGPRSLGEHKIGMLAAALGEVERAFRGQFPNMADELLLRAKPITDHWEARGPGLLKRIGELTTPDLLPPSADILLAQPFLGGYGEAYLPYNTVLLEAVLANADPRWPEVARLGWLIGQLQLETPRFSDRVPPVRLQNLASLALLPPTIEAAEYVELIPASALSTETLVQAFEYWRIERPIYEQAPTATSERVAETLLRWWETYTAARPDFAVALAGLDQLLGE